MSSITAMNPAITSYVSQPPKPAAVTPPQISPSQVNPTGAPGSAQTDSDGDHDGSVGNHINTYA